MFRAESESEVKADIQTQLDEIRLQRLFLSHSDFGLKEKEEKLRMSLGFSILAAETARKIPDFLGWVRSFKSRESGAARAEFILNSLVQWDPSLLMQISKHVFCVFPAPRRK